MGSKKTVQEDLTVQESVGSELSRCVKLCRDGICSTWFDGRAWKCNDDAAWQRSECGDDGGNEVWRRSEQSLSATGQVRTPARRRFWGPRSAAGCVRESLVRSEAFGEPGGDSFVDTLFEGWKLWMS